MPRRPTRRTPARTTKTLTAEAFRSLRDELSNLEDPVARVREELARGLDPNQRGEDGQTLLWVAAELGDAALARLLLDAGADPNAVDAAGTSILAASSLAPELVRALLSAGADVERFGAAALHAAVGTHAMLGSMDSVRVLVAAGVPVDREHEGARALLFTVVDEELTRAKALLALGADPTKGLLGVANHDNVKLARLLLRAGAKVNARDAEGNTALMIAAKSPSEDIVKLLLAAGANPNLADRSGATALHLAAGVGSSRAASALLARGAKVDAKDGSGMTALQIAASQPDDYFDPLVTVLLAAGADPRKTDADGRNALTLALLARRPHAAFALRRAGAREQPGFADAIAAVEANVDPETRRSEAARARAVAYFESRYGPSGTGRVEKPEESRGPGRGARRPDGRVVVWKSGHPPNYVVVVPARGFSWDAGQRPAARKGRAPAATKKAKPRSLEARLASVRALALASGVELRKGVTDAAIAKAEAAMGVRLPDEVRAWFRLNDGIATAYGANGEDLLSLKDVVSAWKSFKGMEREPLGAKGNQGVKPVYWNLKWVPLMHNSGGDYVCLDLDPARGTKPGQMIQVWHDAEERPVQARSFLEWLEGIFWGAFG